MNKTILYVPAWTPASFFEEQQKVTDGDYNRFVISGKTICVARRKILKHPSWIIPNIQSNSKELLFTHFYFKFKSRLFQKIQMHYYTKVMNRTLDSLFGDGLPDVVNFQSVSMFSVLILDWARRKGIPSIVTEHLIRYPEKDTLWNSKKLDVYRYSNTVNCVSYYVLRSLLVTGIPIRNVSVIGNMLDIESRTRVKPIKDSVIFVASHPYDKGLDTFIEVAKLLKGTSWHIDWYGVDGDTFLEDYGVVQDIIESAGINQVVTVKGLLEHKELLKQYNNYSLLLSTSTSETFGLAVAEAIVNKVPVVCTDSGGIRDFVNDKNGIIVPFGDSRAVVDAINKISRIGLDMDTASEEILKKYSKEYYSKIVINIFNNVIQSV